MSYQKIRNLYQEPEVITLFKEAYYLEKIHGTSAHITWKEGHLQFYSGGEKHDTFIRLFDHDSLKQAFNEHFGPEITVVVYGEAYGASQQRMSHTYGPKLKFIVFEVTVGSHWLSVPKAENVAKKLGLEFVHYVKGPATIEFANEQRDAPSVQAVRNGITEPKTREGVIIRPLIELTKNNDERIMAKHKAEHFRETATPREVDPEKMKILENAQEVADEWVTSMRMNHVLDKLSPDGKELTVRDTNDVIRAMIEDIRAESEGEIVWSKEVSKVIGKTAANLFKQKINKLPSC